MTAIDGFGYFAASLVLATFCTRSMVSLRSVAISSNFAFIAYGALAHLWPILLLHAVLLPMNVKRLHEALRHRRHGAAATQQAAVAPHTAPIAVRLRTIDRSRRTIGHIPLPIRDRLLARRGTAFSSARRHSMIAAEPLPYVRSSAPGQHLQAAECAVSMPL